MALRVHDVRAAVVVELNEQNAFVIPLHSQMAICAEVVILTCLHGALLNSTSSIFA
jgi:hypothetical protein